MCLQYGRWFSLAALASVFAERLRGFAIAPHHRQSAVDAGQLRTTNPSPTTSTAQIAWKMDRTLPPDSSVNYGNKQPFLWTSYAR